MARAKRTTDKYKSASLDINAHEILKEIVHKYELVSLSAAIRKLKELADAK